MVWLCCFFCFLLTLFTCSAASFFLFWSFPRQFGWSCFLEAFARGVIFNVQSVNLENPQIIPNHSWEVVKKIKSARLNVLLRDQFQSIEKSVCNENSCSRLRSGFLHKCLMNNLLHMLHSRSSPLLFEEVKLYIVVTRQSSKLFVHTASAIVFVFLVLLSHIIPLLILNNKTRNDQRWEDWPAQNWYIVHKELDDMMD